MARKKKEEIVDEKADKPRDKKPVKKGSTKKDQPEAKAQDKKKKSGKKPVKKEDKKPDKKPASKGKTRARKYATISEDKPLTAREMKFVYELMKDPSNATQAAVRAGVPLKSARVWASDAINTKPNTRKMIQAVIGDQLHGLKIEAEDVLKRIAHVAMTDVTEVVNWQDNRVSLVDSDLLSEGARALVAEVTEQETVDGGRTLKVKTRDSLAAMRLMCQYFGVLEKSAQAKRKPHNEQVEALKAVREGTKNPFEAALDLEAQGVPVPETIRIMMTRWEEPEEEEFTGDIPTVEEMWEKRKERLAEIEAQKEGLPEKQAEVAALKAELGDKVESFKPDVLPGGQP